MYLVQEVQDQRQGQILCLAKVITLSMILD